MATDLLLEIEDGQGPNPEPIAALAEIIHLSAFNDVLRDLPMIGIDPFDHLPFDLSLEPKFDRNLYMFQRLSAPIRIIPSSKSVT
jgi:hypothetical protein